MTALDYPYGQPLALDMSAEVRRNGAYPGWTTPLIPIETRNVNDYPMRSDPLVGLVMGYFNVNIADSPSMMITAREAAALVDLIVSEL